MSAPVAQLEARMIYDILGPKRVCSTLSIYDDHVNIDVCVAHGPPANFDLHHCAVQTLPNLDTLLVLCSEASANCDVYAFLSSKRARDHCVSIMRLLGYCILDEYRARVGMKKVTASISLPVMPTISEMATLSE
jgi:hypothetical protein